MEIKGWTEQLVQDYLQKYTLKTDSQSEKRDNIIALEKINKEIADFKRQHLHIESEFNAIKQALSMKATIQQVQDVRADMDVLATKEDYTRMRGLMVQFDGLITKFRDESIIHSQIIRRYDEVISEKASRISVLDLEDQIHKQGQRIDAYHIIEKRVEMIIGRIEKMKKDNEMKFDLIDHSISMEIVKAVKKTVKQALASNRGKKPSNLNSSFEEGPSDINLFPMQLTLAKGAATSISHSVSAAQLQGDIAYLLSLKANVEDLESMDSTKANKVDTEQLLVSSSILGRQIKHLSVLFMESIRMTVDNPNETKIAKENNKKYLLSQIKSLVNNWIIKFDPMKQNTYQQDEGMDFLKHVEGETLQDYTKLLLREEHKSPGGKGHRQSQSPIRQQNQETEVKKMQAKKKLGLKTSRYEKGEGGSHYRQQQSVWQSVDTTNYNHDTLAEPSYFSYKGAVSINIDQHMKTTTSRFIHGAHNPHVFDKYLGHRGNFT